MKRFFVLAGVLGLAVAAGLLSGSASARSPLVPFGHFRGVVHVGGVAPKIHGAGVLQYHGGPVMRTNTTYAIYWAPAGYSYRSGYQSTINKYFSDVAADNGKSTNVYSVSTQYYDNSGPIAYNSSFAGAFSDTDTYPSSGCVDSPYASVCLTDAQLQAELQAFTSAHGLPVNTTTEYFLFTPLNVGSCFDSTSSTCSYNYYCAYHSNVGNLIYANMPYADQTNANGACDGESHPNGNDADPTINVTSHEHIESITDPFGTAWYDNSGSEIGDLCAWKFGPVLGSTQYGSYDQAINTGFYELQGEYSNASASCAWSYGAQQQLPTITGFSPTRGPHGTTVTITGTHFTGATSVTLRNHAASFTVSSSTQIKAVVPGISKGYGHWTVTTPSGSATSSGTFYVSG
jgi:hypothetical protein